MNNLSNMEKLSMILKDKTPEERKQFLKEAAEFIIQEIKAGRVEAKRV